MPEKKSGRKTYHHGDLQGALLSAADKLVAQKGVAAFSLREAARLVGVDPSACYRHYKDKNELLQALARTGFTELARRMRLGLSQLGDNASIEEKLLLFADICLGFALDKSSLFRVMFGPIGTDARDPSLTGEYPVGEGPYGMLVEAIDDWLRRRGLNADADKIALMCWASVHGFTTLILDGAVRQESSGKSAEVATMHRMLKILINGDLS